MSEIIVYLIFRLKSNMYIPLIVPHSWKQYFEIQYVWQYLKWEVDIFVSGQIFGYVFGWNDGVIAQKISIRNSLIWIEKLR